MKPRETKIVPKLIEVRVTELSMAPTIPRIKKLVGEL